MTIKEIMKKKYLLIILCILSKLYAPHRHSLNIKQVPAGTEITSQAANLFYDTQYQKQYIKLQQKTSEFVSIINNFLQQLNTFATQPLAYQQNYTNFEKILAASNAIKQKPLVIAMTKLLQFKTSTNQQSIAAGDKLINQINTLIRTTENTLAKLSAKSAWAQTNFSKTQKIPSKKTIAQVFDKKIAKPFAFKIKKIKRAITNWQHD